MCGQFSFWQHIIHNYEINDYVHIIYRYTPGVDDVHVNDIHSIGERDSSPSSDIHSFEGAGISYPETIGSLENNETSAEHNDDVAADYTAANIDNDKEISDQIGIMYYIL